MITFNELGLREEILKAVSLLGFNNPTPIQQQAIPMLLNENTDLVGLAQTGTGKTAAFGLPLISKIDFTKSHTQALVICPTRELCLQITKDLQSYASQLKSVNIVAVYGGASIENQSRQLKRGAQVVVATPGRLIDMIDRKMVNISGVSIVVLDEADEMLNMGFKEDIDNILKNVPKERNTWLFSATMPGEVARISRNYMNNPKEITMGKQNSSAENIEHQYYVIKEKDRYFALKRIIDYYPEIFGIIFCRTRNETQIIAEKLIKDGYNCEALHGDLSQAQRDHVMKKFRERTIQLLCATDVAARGIDVNNITHVINYNLPDDIENYTHRSGRTARAGKSGVSIVFVNTRETDKIRAIERQIKKSFTRSIIPNGNEICAKQLYALIDKMANTEVNDADIEPYMQKVSDLFAGMSKEDIIKRFISAEFNRFIEYYRNSEDLNVKEGLRSERNNNRDSSLYKKGYSPETGKKRFFINIGELDNANKGMILRLICDNAGLKGKHVGRIDIKREFSFFEVDSSFAQDVKNALNDYVLPENGRKIRVEESDNKGSGDRSSFKGKKKAPYNKEGIGFNKGNKNFRKEYQY